LIRSGPFARSFLLGAPLAHFVCGSHGFINVEPLIKR